MSANRELLRDSCVGLQVLLCVLVCWPSSPAHAPSKQQPTMTAGETWSPAKLMNSFSSMRTWLCSDLVCFERFGFTSAEIQRWTGTQRDPKQACRGRHMTERRRHSVRRERRRDTVNMRAQHTHSSTRRSSRVHAKPACRQGMAQSACSGATHAVEEAAHGLSARLHTHRCSLSARNSQISASALLHALIP